MFARYGGLYVKYISQIHLFPFHPHSNFNRALIILRFAILHTFTESSLRGFQVSDDAQGLVRVAVLNEGCSSSITKKSLPDRVAKNIDFRY